MKMPLYTPTVPQLIAWRETPVRPIEGRLQLQGCNVFEWAGCAAAIAGCGALTGPALVACLATVAPGCIKCVT